MRSWLCDLIGKFLQLGRQGPDFAGSHGHAQLFASGNARLSISSCGNPSADVQVALCRFHAETPQIIGNVAGGNRRLMAMPLRKDAQCVSISFAEAHR